MFKLVHPGNTSPDIWLATKAGTVDRSSAHLTGMFHCLFYCLSNRKFERLGDPLDEIVTVSVHKYNVIMSRPNMTSFDSRDGLPRRWLLRSVMCVQQPFTLVASPGQ